MYTAVCIGGPYHGEVRTNKDPRFCVTVQNKISIKEFAENKIPVVAATTKMYCLRHTDSWPVKLAGETIGKTLVHVWMFDDISENDLLVENTLTEIFKRVTIG